MPQAFGGYHLLLVITCDQTNFTIAVPLRDRTAQTVAEALIYRVINLFGSPRQIICDEATEFSSAIIQAILCMLNCRLKVISPYNHDSSKCKRQIQTISEIIMKHLWDKGQMWPLFATTAAYAMNTFPSEALSGLSPFQLIFLRDPLDLTSLSFPKIDTIPVKYREYYNLLLARAQLVGNLLLEWRTKQVLEYKSRAKRFRNEEIFQDNQMVYLLALHASVLQTNTMKLKQDFIGPLFIDTALDKTHYRLKDATGLLLVGTYHVDHIKKGSAHTPLGIVDKFDIYETALKNTLLNKSAIKTPNNKLQEVTLKMVLKKLITFLVLLWTMHQCMGKRTIKTKYRETRVVNYKQDNNDFSTLSTCTFLNCDEYRMDYDRQIDTSRYKCAIGIQYKHESKEDIAGFISKPVARPEYGTIYQHKGMLLQNLHCRYLYILIKLPNLLDLEQQKPDFPNCDNYGSLSANNPDPMLDNTPTNDNELHQVICNTFKIDYLREMDVIIKLRNKLECKINYTLPALLPNKLNITRQGLVTSGENIRSKRAIPALAIIQGVAAIGGMMIKGVNILVDAKRASSFNNAIKLVNENVQITHDRLITLENRTAIMAKAIIPVLKDFKDQINNTNDRLIRQYHMMTRAHDRYNRLFRQTHKTFQIHHLALFMFKDYITILVGNLQGIHRQYVRYELALDDTLIGIEHLNSGYLTHRILDSKILGKYLEVVEDDLEETVPEFEPVFTSVYQYYGNSLISFTNTIDDLLLQLPIQLN